MSPAAEPGELPRSGMYDALQSTSTTTLKHVLVALGSPAQFPRFTGCFFLSDISLFQPFCEQTGISLACLAMAVPGAELPLH